MTALMNNKVAFALLAIVVLLALITIFWIISMSAGGIEVAGSSMMRYCVSSGAVCAGTG